MPSASTLARDPLAAADLQQRRTNWVIVLVAGYVAASLVANVMSIRAVTIAGWAVDAGTLTFPLTFTFRDMIHKVAGKQAAYTAIVVTVGLNVAMALLFVAAAKLPGDPSVTTAAQREFGTVLTGTWRIVVASAVAQLVSEAADTEIYQRFVDRFGGRAQFGRVLASNAVSVPIDSTLFAVIAFAGVFPRSVIVEIVVANVVVKAVASFVTAPLIYVPPDLAHDGRTGGAERPG